MPEPAEAQTHPVAPAALIVGVLAGGLIALEFLRPAHRVDAGARAALETTLAFAAFLSVRLLIAIFARSRQLRELLLILGVITLLLADLSYWAGPMIAGVRSPASGGAVRLFCELLGALVLATAALVPSTAIVNPPCGRVKAAAGLGLGAIALCILLAEFTAVQAGAGPAEAATAHSLTVGVQVASASVLALAGLAFVARSWRAESGTELFAGASLLLAASGVQFVTVPTVFADWVTPREGARLVAFALLLGGAWLRYENVRRREAQAAIRSERERMARDLHDGLAQDLVCITTQGQRLDCHLGPQHPLMLASREALAEVRGIIADLTASTAPSSEAAVRVIARDLGRSLDADADVRAEPRPASAADRGLGRGPRDDMIRATRQPSVNPAAHGEGRQADVALLRRGVGRLSARWPLRGGRRRPA